VCPLINDFQENESFFRTREKSGEQVLVYTCLIPGGKWLNRTLDMEKLRQVYFGWGAAHYGTNGYLHWGLNQYYADPFQQRVAKHLSRNEIVIYGGAVHMSKDTISNINGKEMFGRIIVKKDGEKKLLAPLNYVSKLSQEHGTLKVTQKQFKNFQVGDLVEIIPVHSCLTANLYDTYLTTDGETIKTMPKF